ncbi:glutamyl-Q tRNA(Asp) synthetase [Kerstersia gyiorum]|uniref:Glutamyl-Q tRNA(Asp) synthetase n=1 Tax=Kerstersia gyiorum TaxID=206506 RepID=A0A4Q7MXV9_9BURK|nr:tRNA glutamyl-Q(34) synthetase GluQRS [Kerstersia gyiorum]KAB0544010.1 tRNA glutamyl-Q(34) synthetase GluQRS [Kerstersia gyiorum]RZS72980.1 glutamyl-Q tRNA(Asp) synthetase [Kerstersia gyiorum]
MTSRHAAPAAYVGRFAPSPSGPLHAGSLVAAMASWLDARAHRGRWLLRIEDVDTPRMVEGAATCIMQQLQSLGMHWEGEVMWQSRREAAYLDALTCLRADGRLYPCGCTRREIAAAASAAGRLEDNGERPYLGMCRHGLAPGRSARAWRVRVDPGMIAFDDRWLGPQQQNVETEVGDFVLRRADGLWAYQLAVVVDDGDQGVTDIVRGADLLTSTARQIMLAHLLGYPAPRYMHVPLVLDPATGLKLSKQNHAPALDLSQPLETLMQAWRALGFAGFAANGLADFWSIATAQWATRWQIPA